MLCSNLLDDLLITILGSCIGGIFAFLIAKYQIKIDKENELSNQANQVAVVLSPEIKDANSSDLIIFNNSSLPIYRTLTLVVSNRSSGDWNDLNYDKIIDVKYKYIIGPGETAETFINHGSAAGGEASSAAILFDDTRMQHWYRNQFGQLIQLDETEYNQFIKNIDMRPPL